jgi:outer membrane protein assembly factor BamB
LFTATAGGKIVAIDRDSGKLAWQRDLFEDSAGSLRACGYSSSPIAFGDTIIVLAGVPGRSIMALRQHDGMVVWQRHDFANGYSSPTLTEIGGRPELIALMAQIAVGLDPATGSLRWQYPHPTSDDVNVAMPIVGADGLVFLSSGYDGGARALQLSREGESTTVHEVWAHKRFRAHFGTVARLNDIVIGSNGDFGPAPFTAVDVKTGQVLWRDRAVARASFVLVGERAIILDEDGLLVLAAISRTGMVVEARARVLDGVTWTPPTITNDVLLLRNRNTLAAFSLR